MFAAIAQARFGKVAFEVLIALLGSVFLALVSQIAFPLPFTPVPITMQTLGVCLLGAVLGSKRGSYSVLTYLAQGTCGFPVFAGGLCNPLWFLDLKCGFLLSFVAAAFLVGKLLEKKENSFFFILLTFSLGHILISLMGMLWMAFYLGSLTKAFLLGVLPFLMGSALKTVIGALATKGYRRMKVERSGNQ